MKKTSQERIDISKEHKSEYIIKKATNLFAQSKFSKNDNGQPECGQICVDS